MFLFILMDLMSPWLATITHNHLHCSHLLLRASESNTVVEDENCIHPFYLTSLLNKDVEMKFSVICHALYHQTFIMQI